MIRLRPAAVLLALAVFAVVPAPAARAGTDVGVRAGYYFDTEEAFLGGELLTRVAPHWYFNPNLEFVFVENGRLMTLNGDVHYDLSSSGRRFIWLGAGAALINVDHDGPDNGDTDLGLNLFGGVGWRTSGITPYVQAKFILHDDSEFVLAFGIRF